MWEIDLGFAPELPPSHVRDPDGERRHGGGARLGDERWFSLHPTRTPAPDTRNPHHPNFFSSSLLLSSLATSAGTDISMIANMDTIYSQSKSKIGNGQVLKMRFVPPSHKPRHLTPGTLNPEWLGRYPLHPNFSFSLLLSSLELSDTQVCEP
jgi:hypothetical protein